MRVQTAAIARAHGISFQDPRNARDGVGVIRTHLDLLDLPWRTNVQRLEEEQRPDISRPCLGWPSLPGSVVSPSLFSSSEAFRVFPFFSSFPTVHRQSFFLSFLKCLTACTIGAADKCVIACDDGEDALVALVCATC